MRRKLLTSLLGMGLALFLLGGHTAHAALVSVDFDLEIKTASSTNPFGVAQGQVFRGFAIYDDLAIITSNPDYLPITEESGYQLKVKVGNRIFREAEDNSDPTDGVPWLYFKSGSMLGMNFWVRDFSHKGQQGLEFDANYQTGDYDVIIFGGDGEDLVKGNFVTFSNPTPVPVPATLLLFGTGLVGMAGLSRRLKRL